MLYTSETKVAAQDVRKKISDLKLTMLEAATRMGMTTQNLNKHLRAPKLSDHFIRLFKEKLGSETLVSVRNRPGNETKVSMVAESGIPYYSLDVSASNVDVFSDEPETSIKLVVPGFDDCKFAFPVFGHSMYPIYESGSIVICKQITDLEVISFGEAHLVFTQEQRLLKRVRKGKADDTILLLSDNNEKAEDGTRKYEGFEIKKSKIRHLFLVKGSIKRNQL